VIYHCLSPKKNKQSSQCHCSFRYFDAIKEKKRLKSRYRYFDVAAHLHIEVARDCVVYKKTWLPLLMLHARIDEAVKKTI
jgi:hypothetical protein